jgi:hypothetical protein
MTLVTCPAVLIANGVILTSSPLNVRFRVRTCSVVLVLRLSGFDQSSHSKSGAQDTLFRLDDHVGRD